MSKHTPEPWRLHREDPTFIESVDGFFLHNVGRFLALNDENARRIVACVNACRGLDTDDLEKNGLASAFGNQLLKLDAERDALLAALQKYKEAFDLMFGQCCSNGIFDAWGKPVNCTTLNEAHELAGKAIKSTEEDTV